MKTHTRIKISCKITLDTLIDISFILFFSSGFVRLISNSVLNRINLEIISTPVIVLVIYTPLILACICNSPKYVKKDFLILYIFLLLFFLLTYIIHPEYAPYYGRKGYGIWDYVFLPYKGLYAYLFVRLIDNPKRFIRNFKIAGWLSYIYFFYQISLYFRRGYWYGVQGNNGQAELSYSVSFGYEILPFALFFFYNALKYKKNEDIISTVIATLLILGGGSRGPILFYGVFVILYICTEMKHSQYKGRIIFSVGMIAFILFNFWHKILVEIASILNKVGLSSRFIVTMLSGTVTDDSGRDRIWNAAIEMIRENPLGYGAMGAQHKIAHIIYAGYPHSIILEVLIEYGVFIGSAILIFFTYKVIQMLFSNDRKEWFGIFLPFFCTSCCLFISLTYWGFPAFWGCMAITVNCEKRLKLKRKYSLMERMSNGE